MSSVGRVGLIALLVMVGGCVERTLTLETNPPGALVYLNDQEIGRTPVTHEFLWYGNYEVVVRKPGYQTIKTHAQIIAPIYEWVPLDLVAELLPWKLRDNHTLNYTLQPQPPATDQMMGLADRAQDLRSQLQDSERPHPTTQPTTKSTTSPASR